MLAELDAHHDKMMAKMDSQQEKGEACLEKTEAMGETESELEHQEIPKEDAAEETFGALEKRYGDRHLAVWSGRQGKKWTQGNGGSRKKLAVARSGVTRRAGVARRK
jgi:hypothetical protein